MTRPLALVTGASTGIGYELARLAEKQGYDLVVVADEPAIQAAAEDFRRYGGAVEAVQADLSQLEGVDEALAAAADRPVDLLFANAGRGHGGAFLDQTTADWRRTIDTNVTGTLYLLQLVLMQMTARGGGKVLITGSIAGYVPGAFNAVYNATKAFIDNFSEALRNELNEQAGVSLTTLMPGATDTEFFARAGMLDTRVGAAKKADPAKVARDGWEALMAGKGQVVSGVLNKAQVLAAGLVPQSFLADQHRKLAEPGSAGPPSPD